MNVGDILAQNLAHTWEYSRSKHQNVMHTKRQPCSVTYFILRGIPFRNNTQDEKVLLETSGALRDTLI
jgi:hypothetical protein